MEGLRCEDCDSPGATLAPCDMQIEVYDDDTEVALCPECRSSRKEDVL